ncbi:hypothetical protein BpHYR1_045168 [Brachionus plicatilis]|uniref:Uncharacterized protein n=1 Tax=Brachionus plicatilis TaxID=10195 RepID=A0A3M7RRW3_BRAPC|nr:hypothetical protein BpHYR1_045168 [Brachionus plicatilis]
MVNKLSNKLNIDGNFLSASINFDIKKYLKLIIRIIINCSRLEALSLMLGTIAPLTKYPQFDSIILTLIKEIIEPHRKSFLSKRKVQFL